MRALYTTGILLYGFLIRLASLGNAKAKRWVHGRKDLFDQLKKKISADQRGIIWFHCASLGEFEQGRPLMEHIRARHPEYRILLTFFSPSGYEVRKNYTGADIVSYLPLDTKSNARKFVAAVQPKAAIFVKYEFWLNHLAELTAGKIPHYLVSAVFRYNQAFFKWYGGHFREALNGYTHIFTQDEDSSQLLKQLNVTAVTVAGDTRFDRVTEISASAKDIPVAAAFAEGRKVIVAGSTWQADEEVLFPSLKKHLDDGWKLIIAPHETGEDRIHSVILSLTQGGIPNHLITRFSGADAVSVAQSDILVIDNIGMLSSLYRYGSVAFIGGGFGKSIHNTLEAAVYGIPVVFGPAYQKFSEALELIRSEGGFGVHTQSELASALDSLLRDDRKRAESGKNAGTFVKNNTGATQKILSQLTM